jgi:probable LLM family oxidoreductase
MEIGVDSFAAAFDEASQTESHSDRLRNLVAEIERADQVGLDSFGVGEHHRKEFLDSAPTVILGAAAARTERIRLSSAVTVLSSTDPVRLFEQFATIDLLSKGRAEIVAGKGSFAESYPLFGYRLEDYDDLYAEHMDLLLKIRDNEHVTWRGRHRSALTGQGVYPRPVQPRIPIWVGIGGSPQSAARAGRLGLPLMVAIIGGETRRFRPVVDLYRSTYLKSGHDLAGMKVGMHSPGYVAETSEQALDDFYPGFAKAIADIGRERGWGRITRAQLEAQRGPEDAMLLGNPEEVAEKILHHSEALGGIDRVTFQMNAASLPHAKMMQAIDLLGKKVAPIVREATPAVTRPS